MSDLLEEFDELPEGFLQATPDNLHQVLAEAFPNPP